MLVSTFKSISFKISVEHQTYFGTQSKSIPDLFDLVEPELGEKTPGMNEARIVGKVPCLLEFFPVLAS